MNSPMRLIDWFASQSLESGSLPRDTETATADTPCLPGLIDGYWEILPPGDYGPDGFDQYLQEINSGIVLLRRLKERRPPC